LLRNVTPAGIAAQLPQLRAQEQAAQDKAASDRMMAQAQADSAKKGLLAAINKSGQFGGIGKDIIDTEQKIRKEYDARSKDYREARTGYGKVLAAGSNPNPSGADDIALIFGFMKTVDPGSVVRESEFSLAQDTGAAPEKAKAYINRLISGERLTPDMRRYFVDAATVQFKSIQEPQAALEKRYFDISSAYNLDPSRIVEELSLTFKGAPKIVSGEPVGTIGEPFIVATQADGDNLPVGSVFKVQGEIRAQVVE
jgi:hypothetical protein